MKLLLTSVKNLSCYGIFFTGYVLLNRAGMQLGVYVKIRNLITNRSTFADLRDESEGRPTKNNCANVKQGNSDSSYGIWRGSFQYS